jgi:hypothetical protein
MGDETSVPKWRPSAVAQFYEDTTDGVYVGGETVESNNGVRCECVVVRAGKRVVRVVAEGLKADANEEGLRVLSFLCWQG